MTAIHSPFDHYDSRAAQPLFMVMGLNDYYERLENFQLVVFRDCLPFKAYLYRNLCMIPNLEQAQEVPKFRLYLCYFEAVSYTEVGLWQSLLFDWRWSHCCSISSQS